VLRGGGRDIGGGGRVGGWMTDKGCDDCGGWVGGGWVEGGG
jgi:hypothetical protein